VYVKDILFNKITIIFTKLHHQIYSLQYMARLVAGYLFVYLVPMGYMYSVRPNHRLNNGNSNSSMLSEDILKWENRQFFRPS